MTTSRPARWRASTEESVRVRMCVSVCVRLALCGYVRLYRVCLYRMCVVVSCVGIAYVLCLCMCTVFVFVHEANLPNQWHTNRVHVWIGSLPLACSRDHRRTGGAFETETASESRTDAGDPVASSRRRSESVCFRVVSPPEEAKRGRKRTSASAWREWVSV
jgi:hypothetical protein